MASPNSKKEQKSEVLRKELEFSKRESKFELFLIYLNFIKIGTFTS